MPSKGRGYFALLSLTALGVVFGDIGTSPLYAMRAAFDGPFGVAPTHENVLGILSLVFWSLILVVSIKYLLIVLRADNDGEGGILALLSLVHPDPEKSTSKTRTRVRRTALITLGLFGAALLYGDGIITPAISVLSAMEGIEVAQPAFHNFVLPLTLVVLVCLFVLQKRGTGALGVLFGPLTLVWFAVLAALGVRGILMAPQVLAAFNPLFGIQFLIEHPQSFLVLGAVFLTVTGSEALYADMGHFGRGPIRLAWFSIVLPALMLNYMGQGALLLANPAAASNPFYNLAPSWALVPLIVLATMAAVIASQALISGAFSLTAQAVQLGYWPRLSIRHTSEREIGQIYVPLINWALMLGSILIVLEFRTSANLAAAYGIALSSAMMITTTLLYTVMRERWGWPRPVALLFVVLALALDVTFFAANAVKIPDGGWFPLALAGGVVMLMLTWRQGREVLRARLRETAVPIEKFLKEVEKSPTTRVRGHAVYMTGNPKVAPPALVKNLQHNRVLHMRVALLSIVTEEVPHVPRHSRVKVEQHGSGFYRVVARYGFMDEPDAVDVLRLMREHHADFPLKDTTFFLGRERLISTDRPGMAQWRERLFGFMSANAQQATEYFRIPPDRVIEVGSQVEI